MRLNELSDYHHVQVEPAGAGWLRMFEEIKDNNSENFNNPP